MSKVMEAIEKGGRYLLENGRNLEQACYRFHFMDGSLTNVLTVLAGYQNTDGGFGHGLESDQQMPDSSVLATSEAFILMRSWGIDLHHQLFETGIRYLLETYQPEAKGWYFVPENTDQFPRAPWWNYDSDVRSCHHNPRPQLLGDLIMGKHLVPDGLIAELAADVVEKFKADTEKLVMHDLLSYLRLSRTPGLPDALGKILQSDLPGVIVRNVETNPEKWCGYSLYPYQVIEQPDDPFVTLLGKSLQQSIEYMIDQQRVDGCWEPTWNWGGQYPETWEKAKKDWCGVITLNNLLVLKKLGAMVSS